MAEMPVDVINKHVAKILEAKHLPDGVPEAHEFALEIDQELQSKFLFFPDAELSEIAEGIEESRGRFILGQGYAYLSIDKHITATEAYTLAENAAAVYWEVKRREEMEQAKLAKRPEPGVYQGSNGAGCFTVIVPEDRRVLVQMNTGGLRDNSSEWDEKARRSWILQRIDITDGTVQA